MFRFFLSCFILIVSTSCFERKRLQNDFPDPVTREEETEEELMGTDYNILFIGNSLTYTNDLPELIKSIGKLNDIAIGTKVIAKPNYAIIDHWVEENAQREIRKGIFDFVVMQQGPSSQQEGRQLLLEAGELFKPLCDEYDARLAFFMVWPSLTYYQTFDGVIESYEMAAEASDALLCPVGRVWKTHFDNTEDFSYYGPDGFHPSLKGSEVAASVIYATLIP